MSAVQRHGRHVARVVLWPMVGMLVVLAVALAALVWGLHRPGFTQSVLARLPGLEVTAPEGAFLGDFKASRMVVALPRQGRLVLERPAWTGLHLRRDDAAPWGLAVVVQSVSIDRLQLDWVPDPAPDNAEPRQAPASLSLPVGVSVGRLQVLDAVSSLWGGEPVRGLDMSLRAMQPQPDAQHLQHVVQLRGVQGWGWQFSGEGRASVNGDMPVDLRLQAQQLSAWGPLLAADGRATLLLQGPLARPTAQGEVSWRDGAKAGVAPETSVVHIKTEVHPFEAWPLATVALELSKIQAHALIPAVPVSQWSGQATLAADAQGAATLQLAVRNGMAGTWDGGRLPVQGVSGQLAWAQAPGRVSWLAWLQGLSGQLEAVLPGWAPSNGRPAEPGVVHVARAVGQNQDLAVRWEALNPRGLMGSAPDLRSQASLTVSPQLEAPRGLALRGTVQGIHGRGAGERPATLEVEASYREQTSTDAPKGPAVGHLIEIKRLFTRTGEGHAEFNNIRLLLPNGQPWQASGKLVMKDLDPAVWLPWPEVSKGRNAVTGQATFDVNELWQGQAQLKVEPSTLGDVPLKAVVDWQSANAAQGMHLVADASIGPNTLHAKGNVPLVKDSRGVMTMGPDAQLDAQWQAPSLAAMGPWAAFLGADQVQGRTDGQVRVRGRWPQLISTGTVQVRDLQWRTTAQRLLSVPQFDARWDWQGATPQSGTTIAVQASGIRMGDPGAQMLAVPNMDVDVKGTIASHMARWTTVIAPPGARTWQWSGALDGAFSGLTGATPAWSGALKAVQVTESPAAAGGERVRWLSLDRMPIQWQRSSTGDGARAGPATVDVAGMEVQINGLDWSQPLVDSASGDLAGSSWGVQAHLPPWAVAPWLQRWMPKVGWGGDLRLEGDLSVRHTPQQPWQVRATLERREGDLHIVEQKIQGGQPQRLGIREGRIELTAKDGVWQLVQRFNGRVLGDVQARQQITAVPANRLPSLDDPLSGEFALNVVSMRPWGNWLPAGWRLGGKMQAWASLGGTPRVPKFTGAARGEELSASQLLTGVSMTDGRFSLVLDGEQVRLDELVLADGRGGQVLVKGQAELGAQPVARLQAELQRFSALQRIDRRLVVSGGLQAVLQAQDVQATGQLKVDEGLFDIAQSNAPTIGEDVRVVNRPGGDEDDDVEDAGSEGAQRRVDVQVGVDLGQRLRIRGRGLEATLQGALQLTTPNNRPSLTGTVTVKDGVFAAYGQRLNIDRGGITFTGPLENPRLDLRAMRAQSLAAKADDVKVGVTITGTAQDPRIRLYSEPSMSETEKLSWLLLGRAPTSLDGADIGLLQTAAVALLSGENGGPSESVITRLGLDELSVRQTDGTVRETVVNIGKQLSERWYLGYERNLNATTGNWQLIYRAAQRFTLRAQAGDDNALDLIWQFRWNGRAKPQKPAVQVAPKP